MVSYPQVGSPRKDKIIFSCDASIREKSGCEDLEYDGSRDEWQIVALEFYGIEDGFIFGETWSDRSQILRNNFFVRLATRPTALSGWVLGKPS